MTQIPLAVLILVLVILCFSTQIIPLPVTAVLGSLAMMVAGIITPKDAIASFGSDTVMMVAGVIIVGNAVFETGCAQKIGGLIMRIPAVKSSEKLFLMVVMAIVAFLSAFISNTAAVAMFMPLVASVASASNGRIQKKNCYMGMAIASVVGGFCTLAGSTPQMVAQELLRNTSGLREIRFFELAKIGVPLALFMLFYFGTVGYRMQKKCFTFPEVEMTGTPPDISQMKGRKDILSGGILLLCVLGFISGVYSFGTIALMGACACIITGCISQRRAFETMDWSTVIVLGGSIGFATGMEKSGLVSFIADAVVRCFGDGQSSAALVCALIILVAAVLSNVMSNTATVAVLAPLGIEIALKTGADPITFVIGIIIASNLAFSTPISTPPMTMILVGGYRISDYVKVGGLFNVVTVILTMIGIPLIYGM